LPRTTPAGAFRRTLAAAALAAAPCAEAIETPFEAARRGADCDLVADGSLACRYTVGRDLEFELRRVGDPDVALRLLRERPDGDFLVDRDMIGGCVFVRHGTRGREAGGSDFDYAFVSTRNGLVYRQLHTCRQAQ